MIFLLLPLALIRQLYFKQNVFDIRKAFSSKMVFFCLLFTGISQAIAISFYMGAARYTIMTHVALIAGMGGVFIAIFRLIFKLPITKF
jgi:hypothetical protein